nr:hypothetical protein [Tanacetum cinerariifolium]
MVRAKENALDVEIQITSSENVRSHQEAKTEGILLEDLGAIAAKMRKKRLKTKRVDINGYYKNHEKRTKNRAITDTRTERTHTKIPHTKLLRVLTEGIVISQSHKRRNGRIDARRAIGSAGMSTTVTQSRQLSASESAFAKEPVQTTYQMEEPSHPVFETEHEYHLEEVYKAMTDQLDWVHPEGEKLGRVPTEMELILEHTQQGISYEVSVSTEWVEELKRNDKIKGVKKEALLTLGRNRVNTYAVRNTKLLSGIEDGHHVTQ